jgi:hypothetical protein
MRALKITETQNLSAESRSKISSNQDWFWTPRWQTMEQEVDENIAAGRIMVADRLDEMFEVIENEPDAHAR